MQLKRFRWLDVIAVAVVLTVAAALWQFSPSRSGALQEEGDVLREALAVATDECYASYRGVELQACLAGAMQAHLQALGEGTTAEELIAEPQASDGSL